MKSIYLDNNATTAPDPLVIEAMLEELKRGPANPSSIHFYGREARKRLQNAREEIAFFFRVSPEELIFTSSGTEALNIAILGAHAHGHTITSSIEHSAVYNTVKRLDTPLTILPVGESGHIALQDLEKAILPTTRLIVLGAVNSETGVKAPMEEIAHIAKTHKIPLIVDGVAWLGKEPPGL